MFEGSVDVVLIHWNQGEACATTIDRFAADPTVRSVTVVDNGSRSADIDLVRQALDRQTLPTELIGLSSNTGFGPAANRGWERWLDDPEAAHWCAVGPHDAQPEPPTLHAMVAIGENRPHLGLLSADVGDHATPLVDRNFGPISGPSTVDEGFEPADYSHGTLLMARRACLDEIGLFDERFFTYCEEADLGLRAKEAGWEVGLARGARVVNPGVSTPKPMAEYLMERNTLLLLAKHFGRRHALVRAALAVGQLVDRSVRASRRDEYWSPRARLLALRDAALRRWGPPPPSLARSSTD